MKRIVGVILFLFVLFQLKGQENNQLDKILVSAIESYITNNKDLARKRMSVQDTSRYYICMDGLPAGFPFDSVQNVAFFSLNNIDGLANPIKNKLKKGIKTLFVGIKISKNQIIITISEQIIRQLKKKKLNIAISDWGIFTYEYSCEKQKWELKEPKYGGI
ncbi:MAG: hypothetical protein BWY72_00437 [Bacteroidetes bacterium ADurb.Bin416]|nr:MAG: hypothetical protein BWY72_00437 [Bacteroidetes bacterium ADurb.Bin416]